jgi:hypothetical protein
VWSWWTYPENHCTLNNATNWIRAAGERRLHVFDTSDISASFVDLTAIRSTVFDDALRPPVTHTAPRHDDEVFGTALSQSDSQTATETFQTSDDDV